MNQIKVRKCESHNLYLVQEKQYLFVMVLVVSKAYVPLLNQRLIPVKKKTSP